jgi:hypothetical protein
MWQIKRNSILPQLDVLCMVPPKLGIPSSEYFWIRGNGTKVIISAASYIGGEVVVQGQGEWPLEKDFYLDRRLFVPFLAAARELKDKHTFKFEKKGKQLLVTHGSRQVLFDSQPDVKGYGSANRILKHMENTLPISEDLKDMLVCGSNCAVSDSVVPHLNAVYLQKSSSGMSVKLYATSEKVIYMGSGKIKEGKVTASIPFPLYMISLLGAPGLKKIICSGKYIVLQFESGLLWQPISQEAVKDFPIKQLQGHIKKGDSKKVTFITSSRRFSRMMLRLMYYLQSVKKRDWIVKITGEQGKTKIDITTSLAGVKFSEQISTTDKIAKDFKLEWPLDILDPIFTYLSKKTRKLGVIVRVDERHGISYIQVGKYWLCITAKQE